LCDRIELLIIEWRIIMAKEKEAFQDLIGPENHCHGCGCGNEHGLQIKSYWDGDEAVAIFNPKPHHSAGSPDYVNGGILASLVDCHGNNLAMASAYRREGRQVGSLPKIWCVTARLEVSYKAPVPMGKELHLRAKITKQERRKTWLEIQVSVDGQLCVQGELLQIEVARKD
jgi:acyl-coenzyme A thioesterase PaaI-like protein